MSRYSVVEGAAVSADAVSGKGAKFCELFGMERRKDSDHGSGICKVSLLPPEFRPVSRAARELYKVMAVIAAE